MKTKRLVSSGKAVVAPSPVPEPTSAAVARLSADLFRASRDRFNSLSLTLNQMPDVDGPEALLEERRQEETQGIAAVVAQDAEAALIALVLAETGRKAPPFQSIEEGMSWTPAAINVDGVLHVVTVDSIYARYPTLVLAQIDLKNVVTL